MGFVLSGITHGALVDSELLLSNRTKGMRHRLDMTIVSGLFVELAHICDLSIRSEVSGSTPICEEDTHSTNGLTVNRLLVCSVGSSPFEVRMNMSKKTVLEVLQGGRSLGQRSFPDTKAFILRCSPSSVRREVLSAKRTATLIKAVKEWAEIKVVR